MPTILITGGNRGIGRELVDHYAGKGWDVLTTARSDDDLDRLNALDNVTAYPLDVAKPDTVDALVAAIGNRPIDVFLNNAGIYGPREPEREAWLELFEVNSIAPTLLALRLKDNVAASEKKIVAVMTSKMGSIGDNGSGGSIPYRASKAALNAAFKSLAIEWRGEGIGVVLLHPGWVQTDMGGKNALIDTATSVAGLAERIAETSAANSGRFVAYDGQPIPW